MAMKAILETLKKTKFVYYDLREITASHHDHHYLEFSGSIVDLQ